MAEDKNDTAPIPGSPEAPIQIGHTVEQQMRYALSGNRSASPLDDIKTSEEVIKEILDDVVERINQIDTRLESPDFMSRETRNAATEERHFLTEMKGQLESLEPGGTLDLSGHDIVYETEYTEEPDLSDPRAEHEAHIGSVEDLIDQLRAVGISVDTSFSSTFMSLDEQEAELAASDAEILADIKREEAAFEAGRNGLPIPEGCEKELRLLRNYREGLDNPVKGVENEAELRSALGEAFAALSSLDLHEEQARNKEAMRLADSIVDLNRSYEAQRLADNIVSLGAVHTQGSSAAPTPGSPEAPIQVGHTVEQQMRYATSSNSGAKKAEKQDRQSKIDYLKRMFPKIDASKYADLIANIDGSGEKVTIHFHEGSRVKIDDEEKTVRQFGIGDHAKALAWAIADSTLRRFFTHPDDDWGRAKRPGGAVKLSPMSREECDLLVEAWKARGFENASPSPRGVWVEVDQLSTLLDRGSEAFLRGTVTDNAILALMMKASQEWDGRIELIGSDEYKLQAWKIAQEVGVTVVGYEPPPEALANGARKPSDEPAPEPVAQQEKAVEQEKVQEQPSATVTSTQKPVVTVVGVPLETKKSLTDLGFLSLIEASNDDHYDIEPFNDDSPSP